MPQFPPFPTWDSLHPMVIHFPIVLLLVSPLFFLISAALPPPHGRPYTLVALLLLWLGTGSLFLAAASGHAAALLAERGGSVDAILKSHEEMAMQTEIVFSVLCLVMLAIVALPRMLRREETRLTTTWMPLSFLVLYCVGILFVINTAHAGGRLVHEFCVHAIIPAETSHSNALPNARVSARMDEGH